MRVNGIKSGSCKAFSEESELELECREINRSSLSLIASQLAEWLALVAC
jgi:hypothetical protein